MTLEMSLMPERESLLEIRSLSDGELEEHLSALFTCSVELSLNGQSLLKYVPEGMRQSPKLDSEGFHHILCLEFLSNLLKAANALTQGSSEEDVTLTTSLYSLVLQRNNNSIRISIEDELRSYHLGQFPFKEFKLAVVVAAKSIVKDLVEANPNVERAPQASDIIGMIAKLAR